MQTMIAKEQRQERILLSLKKLDFLSRSQIQRLHRLGGDRNANRVLAGMSDYLNTVRLDEKVYYLNALGRDRVGATKVVKSSGQIDHYLMRNALYLAYGCPATWENEIKLTVTGKVSVVADAIFRVGKVYNICEIDRTQKMAENRTKVDKYRELLALGVFEKRPKLIWVTTTEYRRKQLAKLCEGLDVRIYVASELN